MEILEDDVEDVLWMRLIQEEQECLALAVYVCYVPPKSSSQGGGADETFQLLAEQMAKFGFQGPLILCGDLNARCGKMNINVDSEGVPVTKVVGESRNNQGEHVG